MTIMMNLPKVGDSLPQVDIAITRKLIVGGAIATRDYQDVHHDSEAAKAAGTQDIFMNILTTNGLVSRYVSDSFGHHAKIRKLSIRLGAPNFPGDTMSLTGSVVEADESQRLVLVRVQGRNSLGDHVTGEVALAL
ncbi:MAG: MaoC/PaaZ C-terminal domain-containing protein [Pseudomonadota bacterium]